MESSKIGLSKTSYKVLSKVKFFDSYIYILLNAFFYFTISASFAKRVFKCALACANSCFNFLPALPKTLF